MEVGKKDFYPSRLSKRYTPIRSKDWITGAISTTNSLKAGSITSARTMTMDQEISGKKEAETDSTAGWDSAAVSFNGIENWTFPSLTRRLLSVGTTYRIKEGENCNKRLSIVSSRGENSKK